MSTVTFFIQKEGQADDIIYFSNVPGMERVYSVQYAPNDVKGSYTFTLQHRDLYSYVTNILTSLTDDVEPFDRFQVTSRISPSIVYTIEDLYSQETRTAIYDTVSLALTSRARFHKNE